MQEFMNSIWKMIVESNVLNLLAALLILVCGWLIAILVSRLVGSSLKKIGIGKSLAICLPEEEANKVSAAEKFISGVVYYLLLILTVLACLTALKLDHAAEPLKNFMDKISGYAPNIIAAVILVFVAWLIATALKYISLTAMNAAGFDEKITKHIDTNGKESKLSYTIASVIYWLTFIFFIPAVLKALGIEGITAPLENMFTKVFNFIPNLIAAAAIAVIGLFIAGLVRRVVTKFLIAVNLDMLGEKAGVSKVFDQKSISYLIGIVAYALIALPVIISALNTLQIESLTGSVSGLFDKVLNATGNIFGAAVLIFVAYIAGSFVAGIVIQLLEGFGFNRLIAALGFYKVNEESNSFTPSVVIGKLTMITIMFMAFIGACEILELHNLAELLKSFIPFAGKIIVGIIVFMIGIFLSNFAANAIRSKGFQSDLLSFGVRVIILFFAGALALSSMEIGSKIVQMAFTLILGAVAVAAALAFGLGGREFAAKKLEEWNSKSSKKE